MNIVTSKKITILLFTICTALLSAQQSCELYENKMDTFIESDFEIAEAEKLYEEYLLLDCVDLLLAYNFIAFSHYNNSDLEKAKEFLIRGENEFFGKEDNNEQFAINQTYNALILIIEKDFDSALYHLNKAEQFVDKETKGFVKASIYQNIGLVKVQIGELEEAEEQFDRAIKTDGLDSLNVGYIFQNLAFLYLQKNNSEKTQEYIDKTKSYWDKLSFNKGNYLLSLIEAKLAIKEKDFTKAQDYLEKGRSVYDNQDKLLLGENYLLEAQIQDKLGNTQAKSVALKNAILESDDLTSIQLKEAISSLSKLQDAESTNIILVDLISKLKSKNSNQIKRNLTRSKYMDTKTAEDESVIETQLKYLVILAGLLLLLLYLFLRLSKQKDNIQSLNKNLESSKVKIEHQVDRLKQKNKELEQFAYVASHDLKSPLRNISLNAGLLKRKYGSDDINDYLDIITNSAKNMSLMISELLNHSTLDQKIKLHRINLKSLIDEALERIAVQVSESQAKVQVLNSCDLDIHCDKTLFVNVIQNLISNSIAYCKEDEIPEISISAVKNNDHVMIDFSDNGIGIEKANRNQIFEIFTRLKTKKVDGTGIGLSTCKKIIEAHNGKINVDSNLGFGSTFTIKLPFSEKL